MTIKVLNQEFDFDIFDLDAMERYENAHKNYVAAMTKARGADVSALRASCDAIAEFLESVLGEGAREKLFGGKTNYRQYLQAGYDLIESVGAQREEFQREQADRAARIAKYIPNKRK